MKVPLKLNRISQWRQRRLRFLPGSPPALGEAGCLIRDTAETTERLKHTWRHETGLMNVTLTTTLLCCRESVDQLPEISRSHLLLFRGEVIAPASATEKKRLTGRGRHRYSRSRQQLKEEEEHLSSR
ncbi:hypothetical protein Q8A73_011321 [Channa argus]|nr:hypothetical protein Q8A73_011321 [Channa argus]